jgi:hypothetical protein
LQAGSSSKKGNVLNTSPFYWIKPPAGLTDWHWASARFFYGRAGSQPWGLACSSENPDIVIM